MKKPFTSAVWWSACRQPVCARRPQATQEALAASAPTGAASLVLCCRSVGLASITGAVTVPLESATSSLLAT